MESTSLYLVLLHVGCCLGCRLDRLLVVLSVNENSVAQFHYNGKRGETLVNEQDQKQKNLDTQLRHSRKKITVESKEWKVLQLPLGHDHAVCWKDPSQHHQVQRTLVVAHEDGGRGLQVLLARDLECDTAGVGSEVGEDARDNIVDGMALVEQGKNDRDEAAHDRHDQGGDQHHHELAHELGLFGEMGEERGQNDIVYGDHRQGCECN